MKIRKILICVLLCLMFSMTAFSMTAFAAEGDEPDPNAFTPGGSGTVIDNVLEQNGKEFYTIKTEDGNIFYLVIDRLRANDNVYFLNAVTEKDLMALAEKSGKPITPGTPAGDNPGEEKPEQPGQEKPPAQKSGLDSNTTTMIFVGIAVVAVGVIGFYFKIVKGKKNKKDDDEFDEYDYDDDDNNSDDDSDDDPEDD